MEDIKLRDCHIEGMKKIPFWFLFKELINKKLSDAQCRKFDADALKVLKQFGNKNYNFSLGAHNVKMIDNDC